MSYLFPFVAALVTLLLTAIMLRSNLGKKIEDVPNERSLHTVPTPRIGGVGMMAGVLSAWSLMFTASEWWLVLPLFGLFLVSLLDDMRSLPVSLRLLAHLVAAAVMIAGSGLLQQGVLLAGLLMLCTVWMTNLYNFMDGSDGLAGGMAVIGFGALALAAWLGDAPGLAAFCASIAAAALAFLRFNFPPARVFMGDAGSIPLGFMAAALGILGARQNVWPWLFPLLVFSPFIVDASVTLARRGLRGETIWQAHRSHYYQRVVLLGASHRQLALSAYTLMLAVVALAFVLLILSLSAVWVLILSATTYLLIFRAIDRRWRIARNEH